MTNREKVDSLQAKDISADLLIRVVAELPEITPEGKPGIGVNQDMARHELEWRMGVQVPEKVFLAKCKKLIDSGRLSGCACGCRGELEVRDRQAT